jgi:hypothetical protein
VKFLSNPRTRKTLFRVERIICAGQTVFNILLTPLMLFITSWWLQDAIFNGASGQSALLGAAVAFWVTSLFREIEAYRKALFERKMFDEFDEFYSNLDPVQGPVPGPIEDEQA